MTAMAYDPLARIDYKDSTVVYSAFGRLGWPIRNAACGYAEWDHWDADGCDLQLVNVQSHGEWVSPGTQLSWGITPGRTKQKQRMDC